MEIFEVCQEHGLTHRSSSSHTVSSRQIPFQERAFSLGNVIGVNAYRVNRDALKQRIAEGGYQVDTTPHFLVCQQSGAPTIVVHWFSPAAIDGDLGYYFLEELKPFGIDKLNTSQDSTIEVCATEVSTAKICSTKVCTA